MIENILERIIFASRWILAPFYLGLVGSMVILLVKFVQEFIALIPIAISSPSDQIIVGILELIDLSLAGNLMLMVIFAGYENFVSKIDCADSDDRPSWMGTVDFSGLKLKLIASIVAISGIHLLKEFMEIDHSDKTNLFWLLVTHMTFIGSGLLLAIMDRIGERHVAPIDRRHENKLALVKTEEQHTA